MGKHEPEKNNITKQSLPSILRSSLHPTSLGGGYRLCLFEWFWLALYYETQVSQSAWFMCVANECKLGLGLRHKVCQQYTLIDGHGVAKYYELLSLATLSCCIWRGARSTLHQAAKYLSAAARTDYAGGFRSAGASEKAADRAWRALTQPKWPNIAIVGVRSSDRPSNARKHTTF